MVLCKYLEVLNLFLRLDLQFFAGEKTEKATPKKRQDERKKGKVAKSQDINSAILLILCFLGLFVFSGSMKADMMTLYKIHTLGFNRRNDAHTVCEYDDICC